MSRQTWIAKRRLTRIEERQAAEVKWEPAARLMAIKIIDQWRDCEFMKTPWSGLVLVDVGAADWPEQLRVTDCYTLTHEQSTQRIAAFRDLRQYERFVTDPEVVKIFNKIKWYKPGAHVIEQMQPHYPTFKELRIKHECSP